MSVLITQKTVTASEPVAYIVGDDDAAVVIGRSISHPVRFIANANHAYVVCANGARVQVVPPSPQTLQRFVPFNEILLVCNDVETAVELEVLGV